MREATISTPSTPGTPGAKGAGGLTPSPFSTLDKLLNVAWPGAVYSAPITAHDQTLITASEVTIGMGMGFGSGSGPAAKTSDTEAAATSTDQRLASGSGGGGGGRSNARPVAVISVSPAGVRIQPIVDVSRLLVTAASTLGALLVLRGVRRLRA